MTGQKDQYHLDGPIAEKYDELQGLPHLKKAWEAAPVKEASHLSVVKAMMHASVIALLNMQDLMERATEDLKRGDIAAAATKREWESRFSRILNDISRIHERTAIAAGPPRDHLNILTSQAFDGYFAAVQAFDRAEKVQEDAGHLPLGDTIASKSMNDAAYRLVQHTRRSFYDVLSAERNLRHINISRPLSPEQLYRFMGGDHLYRAVHALAADAPELKDQTFFNQFRGLHQIPEILVHEQNDHLEQAIKDIHAGKWRQALEHMAIIEALFEPVVASVRNMAETLTTNYYHRFRKHLGLTSGSQSEEIRHRLFIKNYRALWEAVSKAMESHGDPQQLLPIIDTIDMRRHDNEDYHLKHELLNACMRLRASILRWRDSHLHLARSMLGSGGTKSLIGSPDAIEAVTHMLEAAHGEHDPMHPLMTARGLDVLPKSHAYGPLEKQVKNPDSFLARIEAETGRITQERFPDVQYRSGFFSRSK